MSVEPAAESRWRLQQQATIVADLAAEFRDVFPDRSRPTTWAPRLAAVSGDLVESLERHAVEMTATDDACRQVADAHREILSNGAVVDAAATSAARHVSTGREHLLRSSVMLDGSGGSVERLSMRLADLRGHVR